MDHQSLDPLVALGYAVATIRLIPGLGAGYQKSEFFALSVAVPGGRRARRHAKTTGERPVSAT